MKAPVQLLYDSLLGSRTDDNNVLWETRNIITAQVVSQKNFAGAAVNIVSGTMTSAVCRPESCSDGHKCGRLDIGVMQ